MSTKPRREKFSSRLTLVVTMVGVAVGLGNVWRFPYMVGTYGGAAFVLFYLLMAVLLGLPALLAEWILGRHTRRGPVGAFARAGLPMGRLLGWIFFFGVTAAAAYYTNVIGWVLVYTLAQGASLLGSTLEASVVLPPSDGFDGRSLLLQLAATTTVILTAVAVLRKGLRSGIEAASKVLIPLLLACLTALIVRSATLPGAWDGVVWYILKFDLAALTPTTMLAALGHAIFSLSLGGTFMVVYGSYLDPDQPLTADAAWTVSGDLIAGLLAGLAVFPAVFALGLEPGSGPGLIFFTLPQAFASMPAGELFGFLFFLGLWGAAFLSDIAALEVLVAGLTDNSRLSRDRAVWVVAMAVFLLALPPMLNMKIFVPWDLTFGSGLQTVGALLSVVTVGWWLDRRAVATELAAEGSKRWLTWLLAWLRYVVPGAIVAVGAWWLLKDVLGLTS